MKKSGIYFSIVISFMLHSCKNNSNPSEEEILHNLKREIEKREFIEDAIDSLRSYVYEGKVFLTENNLNSFFIIDNHFNRVSQLDDEMNLVNTFLKNGDGPNEHVGIKRFFNFSNSSYTTFDHSQQLFRLFDNKDSILVFNKFEGDRWVDDIAQLNDSVYLFPENYQDEYSFVVKDLLNNKLSSRISIVSLLNSIIPARELEKLPFEKNLIFEGYFSQGSGDKIVYTCNKAGLFFVFSDSGEFLYVSRTIDKLPIPKFGMKEISPGYFLHEVIPDLRGTKSRAINQDYIFILSNILLPSYSDKKPIDVYSSKDGVYQFSFFVPKLNDGQVADQISVWQNYLYVLFENSTIVQYELNFN